MFDGTYHYAVIAKIIIYKWEYGSSGGSGRVSKVIAVKEWIGKRVERSMKEGYVKY